MSGSDRCSLSETDITDIILSTPSVEALRQWSQIYSASTHLAGDHAHASSISALWRNHGIPTTISRHRTSINHPGPDTAVRLINPQDASIAFEASFIEDVLPCDPTSSIGLPAFHGLSHPGRVLANLVYANFGRPEDFRFLEQHGISVQGRIVLCKYSANLRGLKVRAAQEAGAAGVILYNDPQEDGDFTVANGYRPYPDGPARHPSAIQRGSVSFFSIAAGQYPRSDFTPQIPSVPISYRDARRLLEALEGRGMGRHELPLDWQGALPGIEYCTGPTETKVELINDARYCDTEIHNVIGKIEGESVECVILGNHHDSWSTGAVDPISGSAVMNEVARSLGSLLQAGWKPWRTVILASWDNEEYGLVGSTTWAIQNQDYLSENCVAYINVDEATNGGQALVPVASPLLARALYESAKAVPSPLSESIQVECDWMMIIERAKDNDSKATVFSDWLHETRILHPSSDSPLIENIGTGSDFTVFQHHLGIPSADLVFNGGHKAAVFQYHSKYDSFLWMEKFGDPGFQKHKAMAQLWGLLTWRLASNLVLDFSATSYAMRLKREMQTTDMPGVDLTKLHHAISILCDEAANLDAEAEDLRRRSKSDRQQSLLLKDQIGNINRRYKSMERGFLDPKGLPQRPWYKHVAFGPGLWEGYGGVIFPAIADAILANDEMLIQDAIETTVVAVRRVTTLIQATPDEKR